MRKEEIKNLLVDFICEYDMTSWSNEKVYEKFSDLIYKQISDLEAKLAESEKENKRISSGNLSHSIYVDKKIERLEQQLAEKENTITNLIEDSKASKELLKKELKDKDNEIESLRTRQFIDMTEKEMLELKIATHNEDLKKIKHIFDQDKISFAVDKLTEVKKLIENKLVEFDDIEMKMIMGLFAFNITCQIDNQINELKKEKK